MPKRPYFAPTAAHRSPRVRHAGISATSVSGRVMDRVIEDVQDKLSPFLTLVDGWQGVVKLLAALERSDPEVDYLDLIGHSNGNNLLELGNWVVGKNPTELEAFCKEAQPHLKRLGIRAVRLVGCDTAEGVVAKAVLNGLEQGLKIAVYGTGSLIDAEHFSYRMCISENFKPASQVSGVVGASPPSRSAQIAFRRLRSAMDPGVFDVTSADPRPPKVGDYILSPADFARLRAQFKHRDAGAWRMPGLLRKPSFVLIAPDVNGQPRYPVEVFFDGELVRLSRDLEPDLYYVPRDLPKFQRLIAKIRART
jgi:hypothetical protein